MGRKGTIGKKITDEELRQIQDEHNFGSAKRFLGYITSLGYDRTQAKKWWEENDTQPPKDAPKKVMYKQRNSLSQPVFSTRRGGWQFDTISPNRSEVKGGQKYQLFFVNNNTREIKSYPMTKKSSAYVKQGLEKFFAEMKRRGDPVSSLTSDKDPAYQTDDVLKYLASKGVDYHTTVRENHHALGILNRAVHTIRHKGWVSQKPYIQDKNWQALVKSYNEEKRDDLGKMSPNDMANNPDAEIDYIAKKMNESDAKREKAMKGIEPGQYVRVFNDPNFNSNDKNKRNLEDQTYRVQEIDGGHIWLTGRDETSFKRVPRYLVLTDPSKVQVKNLADNVPAMAGDVKSVSDYKNERYKVNFDDGTSRNMTWRELREGRPLKETLAEKEYWVKRNEEKKNTRTTRKGTTQLTSGLPISNTQREDKDELPIWKEYDELKTKGEI